jgi:4-hydroxy-2-oxoheptanedioate aldolase
MNAPGLKELRSKQGVAWGLHLGFLCPEIVEFAGRLGFTWLFLDAEHTPVTPASCRELVRAADVVGMPCLVRVPEIRASVIEGFLDVGVLGILAPAVATADEARALVAAVKFSPEGMRGAASRSRAAGYGVAQRPEEYCALANRLTFTAALIENQSGVDHLEDIMGVPGIDAIAIGPNDLGFSLGIAGGMADPRVRTLVESAQARIRSRGKPQLTVVSDAPQARRAVAAGATLVAVSDAALLATAGRSFLEDVIAGVTTADGKQPL